MFFIGRPVVDPLPVLPARFARSTQAPVLEGLPMFHRRIPLAVLVFAGLLAAGNGHVQATETFSADDQTQLKTYAADTWRSLAAMVQPGSGLPTDALHRRSDGSWVSAGYTSPTDIGAYLWNILAAESLKLIPADEADTRLRLTLKTLATMPRSDGFYFNWYDPVSAEPLKTWPVNQSPVRPFLSSVDNGWLAAALMMVGNAKPALSDQSDALLRSMNFGRFYDAFDEEHPTEHPGLFHVGIWPDSNARTTSHYGLLNTEARIISYVAISRGQVPAEHYFRLQRTLPANQSWQQQIPAGQSEDVQGVSVFEGHYTYRGLRLVPSWGGSMFEALMVALFVPEAEWAPESWGVNHPLYVRAQVDFGRTDSTHGVWGFSPSSRPGGGYAEYGVPALGSRHQGYPARDPGDQASGRAPGYVVTPHASFLSLAFAPAESLANLAALAGKFPAYGTYGFYDAVNVSTGDVAASVLVLDQGMILTAIANALDDRVMQRHFTTGAVEKTIRPLIAPERFTAGTDLPLTDPLFSAHPAIAALPGRPLAPPPSAGQ